VGQRGVGVAYYPSPSMAVLRPRQMPGATWRIPIHLAGKWPGGRDGVVRRRQRPYYERKVRDPRGGPSCVEPRGGGQSRSNRNAASASSRSSPSTSAATSSPACTLRVAPLCETAKWKLGSP